MAAARKSDTDKPKKSIMPRLFVGVWLVALTVLLVIMFTNMPEKRNGGQGKELVKKITVPLPEEIQNLATRASVNGLENRVETVETKTAQVDEIRRKVTEHDGDIAVLDQRVDRLETTVSDKLTLPSRSFSEIPAPPAAETPEPAKTAPTGKAPKGPADKTADPPPPVETPTDGTAASTPSAQPTDGTTASASTPQPTDKTEAPSATEQPTDGTTASASTPQPTDKTEAPSPAEQPAASDGKKPTPSPRKPGGDAGPATAPPDVGTETPEDRRSVQRKIAAREAYIRRTAPLRRTGDWAPPPEDRAAMNAGDRGATPQGAEGYGPDEYAASRAGRVQPPYTGKQRGLPIGSPAGSLHRAGSRFGHRVDLSHKLDGADGGRDPKSYGAKTAPGMTIFPDRRLDPMKMD